MSKIETFKKNRNKEETIKINNERDTRAFGVSLAKHLKSGDIVALIGDLGTGKTTLVKAIAEGLGIKSLITSPTFTIVREYDDGRLPLYHFDVYRISDAEEMYELGYEEYFYGAGICVIEWADLIADLIPENALVIRIEYGTEPDVRLYHIQEPKMGKLGEEE